MPTEQTQFATSERNLLRVLHNAIIFYNKEDLKDALVGLKKIKVNNLDKSIDDVTSPPIITAITSNNLPAVQELLRSGLVDPLFEFEGDNAITCASGFGNPRIFNEVYANLSSNSVNSICYNTPLISVITQLSSYSLIHDSSWGVEELKNKLVSWYNSESSIKEEIGINEYQPNVSLEANWHGSLGILKALINAKANPKVQGNHGLSAEYIADNIHTDECLKLFEDSDVYDSLKFISKTVDNNILTFNATIVNNAKTKKIRIKLNYDTRQVKKLINEAAQKVVGAVQVVQQKPSFKEWDERFNKLAHEVNAAASHASTATALAIGAHAKADTLTTVVNTNGAVLAHTIGRVDKTEVDIKTLAEDYSPLKEAANIARELAIIKANKVQHSFYESVFKKIDDFITSNRQLNGGMVQNQNYSIAHKIASGIELVGGKIPIVGIASGLLSKAISKGADIYEGRKWERVYHLVPADHVAFSKELAMAITKAYSAELTQIGVTHAAKPDEAIRQALKLATKAADIITESMSDTKVDKTKGVPQGVVTSQVKTLQDNKAFADKVEKYAPASARVEKRELVGKTHSPGKVTGIVVTVATVPSQPLGPTATAKPTPPPVPAKPVVFSATPATAMASSAFMAQMNVTVAATAARKLTQAQ